VHGSEYLAYAITWLDVPGARFMALDAVGDRDNLFRLIAAGALYEIGQLEVGDRANRNPTTWWREHSDCFTKHTNSTSAVLALKDLEAKSRNDSRLELDIERTKDLIRQEAR
jgi:hypothetical protein